MPSGSPLRCVCTLDHGRLVSPGKPSPHRVQRDVAEGSGQMRLVHHHGTESALPEMGGTLRPRVISVTLHKLSIPYGAGNLCSVTEITPQQLSVHTIGGVVTPAQGLLVIVPDQDGLIAEVQVNNDDVGFVHEGQTAEIKVETFNFTRYGLIEGTVTSLSRDVVADSAKPQDKKNEAQDTKIEDPDPPKPTYVARITLSRDWMATENGHVPLGPGMAVTGEIQTGRRRIIDFLLSPIVRRIRESGHER